MGKNQSASNLTNIIKQDGSGNIVFTSGSTTLATISTTGQLSGSTAVKSATTASYADSFTVTGNLTAQTLVVQTITSSVDFVTGSTRFGSFLTNTHIFSGSVAMNPGGLFVSGSGQVGIGTTNPATKFDLAGTIGNFQIASSGAEVFLTRNENNDILATGGTSSGITIGAQSYVRFSVGTSYTERMRVTSTGGVYIGGTNFGSNTKLGLSNSNAEAIEFDPAITANTTRMLSYNRGTSAYISSQLVAYDIQFQTSGTERMRLTNAGNLGIGTNNPLWLLDVRGAIGALNSGGDGTLGDCIYFGSAGYPATQNNRIRSSTSASGPSNLLSIETSNGTIGSYNGNQLVLKGNGNVYIGTTSGNDKLTVNGSIRAEGGSGNLVFSGGGTGPIYIDYPGIVAGRMNLDNNGALTIRGALTQNASDRRLKNNIQNIPDALNKISQLNGITFTWDTEIYNIGRTNDIGVIAQEVQEVLPYAVELAPFDTDHVNGGSLSGENYLTVYYEKLIPLLIEGIKELNTKLDAANAEIEALKNK